jgi:exopolysaccharide biosynthesis polyprenyl glycosylphosphotransferase
MTTSQIGGRIGLQERRVVVNTVPRERLRPAAGKLAHNFLSVVDMILLGLAAWWSPWIRFVPHSHAHAIHNDWSVPGHNGAFFLLYEVLFLMFAHARGLYAPSRRPEFARESFEVLKVSLGAAAAVSAFVYELGDWTVSREAIGATLILSVILLIAWRAFLRFPGISGLTDARNVLIVGAGAEGKALQQYLADRPHLGFSVVGFTERRIHARSLAPGHADMAQPMLGPVSDLESIIRTHFIDEVLITLPNARDLIQEVVARARLFGTQVRVVPDHYGGLALGAPIESLGQFPTFTLHSRPNPALQLTIKRFMDAALSAVALVLLIPLFLLIAILIKFDSEGPVFYNSVRLGKKGKTFICHKFRSMAADAERRKESLQHLNEREGILFKISNDPRVTRLGRFLRKWSLDELPQLWNVLKGDMSLVGPRPPIPEEFKQYSVEHLRRLEVVPGLTGLWQVQSRQSPYFDDYIQLDLEYVDSWSVWLDFTLIAKTFLVILAGTGR